MNEDSDVFNKLLTRVFEILNNNMLGPDKYMKMYEEYAYILNGEASKALDEFFETEPFPYLKVTL